MLRKLFFLIFILSLLANFAFLISDYRRDIVRAVPDGDSLDLADGRRVRLLAIDAPEKGRCLAEEARGTLERLSLGKHVRLKNIVKDDYGRILANVILESPDNYWRYLRWWLINHLPGAKTFTWKVSQIKPENFANRALVKEGLAKFNHLKNEYYPTLLAADKLAKDNSLGIYSSLCRRSEPIGECKIKGNLRQGKRVYYTPDCRDYKQVIVDEAYGDRWFCTIQEAIQADYSPCFKL